ncbi:GFA family protein [Breoghania sp. L-A4]|uniref:GFA family protein n=1 Tax=Breoghania sp. L-A4 TaxID=2304600 RepID=UPI000E35C7C9|nr:GFA family protein [Breoghania sp. L-A4]AXS40324.1 GFA family protein [Breoghania sp. L-A4]
MKPSKLPLAGACRCGGVTVEISAPPLMTAACHCTGCQKMSGSAFSLTAMIPGDAFSVTKGDTVIGGLKGPQLHHHFCPDCMSWMFTRIEGLDAFVNVRPSLFDDHAWFSPFIETMTREKHAWAQTPARHHFEGFPPMEEMQKLFAEFAAAE